MQDFWVFLHLGLKHILDLAGYDHLMFVVALCVIYTIADWKNIISVITFFTIGHSITLALSVLNIVVIKSELIELLIPITILITAIGNIVNLKTAGANRYWVTLAFGFIHGMGFSNYLKGLLGQNTNIIKQLFAFNVGLEIGQIIIVSLYLGLSYIIINFIKLNRKTFSVAVSIIIILVSFGLIMQKIM